jgi:hypothetical protein
MEGTLMNQIFRAHVVLAVTILFLVSMTGAALAASGSVGGATLPVPSVTQPVLNQQYNVDLTLFNTSVSNEPFPNLFKPITVDVNSVILSLACDNPACGTVQNYVSYVDPGGNGCVSNNACVTSCTPIGTNQVQFNLNNCSIAPGGSLDLATVRVQQDVITGIPNNEFLMVGNANYQGTAGVCSSGTCDNTIDHSCTVSDPDCNWASLSGSGAGSANLTVIPPGDEVIVPTMTEWGMFIFMVLAGIGSLYYVRRMKKI